MPRRVEAAGSTTLTGNPTILLVMVPGMGMQAGDFQAKGFIAAVEQRRWPVTVTTSEHKADAYLDGSVEVRLLRDIEEAQRATGTSRVWMAGISLGCRAILGCVRLRPDLAEGLLLLTPYLASTGLIAEVAGTGGLRRWAEMSRERDEPDRAFLTWLATTAPARLPWMLVGHAREDRFANTAAMLADLIPAERMIGVPGGHDWTSWTLLWHLMLEQDPFGLAASEIV
jgi:pimeloyl-ACP methyl ester carboxylesterase